MSLNKKKIDCYENIRGLSVTGQKGLILSKILVSRKLCVSKCYCGI